jgi:hypothetical protein
MLLFIWARPPRFSSRVGPRARSPLPPRFHCHRGPPVSAGAPLSEQRRAASGSRPAGTRSGHRPPVGARPHAAPTLRGTPTAGPPLSSLFFPLSPAADRARSKTRPDPPSSAPSSPTPLRLCRAPHLSPRLPRPYRRPRSLEDSPSRRILLSAATVFPLSGERPTELHRYQIKANFIFPLLHRCCRTPHPPSPPIGAPSLLVNAAVPSPSSTSPPPRRSGTHHPRPPCLMSPRRVAGALGVHLVVG